MSDALAREKSLLFALLALQNGFIQREQLMAAFTSWMADKSQPLDAILAEQSAMSDADRAILTQLVERHLRRGDNVEGSQLSLLEQVHTVREALFKEADEDPELSRVVHTLVADETLVYQPPQGMAEAALASNRFRLIKEHASGGLGRVFLAEDVKFGRQVALKQIRGEYAHKEEYRAKFLVEAEITAQLEHPSIVPVYALGEDDLGRPFYAMRFIKGEDLKSRIKSLHRQSPLGRSRSVGTGWERSGLEGSELRQLLRHFIDACQAISYAHDRGVLHRDLKPSNIMLGKYGETLVVDWGLAKPLGTKLNAHSDSSSLTNTELPLGTSDTASGSETRYGSFVGTAAYAPPEQVLGSLDKMGPTSDVYSLGAILYELLAGQPPLVGKDLEILIRQVTCGEIVPIAEIRPDAPAALVAVCRKAMALEQKDRYQSVAELRQDIQRWLDDVPVSAYREPRRQRTARWLRRHPRWVAALASALIIGTAGIAIGSLLLEQKNQDLREKNLALEVSQREADQRRRDAELALHDSLVSQAQLLVRQAAYPGWSWDAEQKLIQASELAPSGTSQHRLRSLMLASTQALDLRSVASLVAGIDCYALCFSPDGRYLAIGQRKHNLAASVYVFETTNWQLIKKFSVSAADGGLTGLREAAARLVTGDRFQEGVLALAFSPDGRWLAAGTRLGRIHVWAADENFQLADASAGHASWQAFSDGGVAKLVFSLSGGNLWASSDARGKHRCLGWMWREDAWIAAVEPMVETATELVSNGRGLLASLSGGQVKWFDGRSTRELRHASLPVVDAQAIALAPATRQMAYADSHAVVHGDLETGRQTRLHDIEPEYLNGKTGLCFNASGQWLAITADLPQVLVVATVNGKLAKRVIPVPGRNRPTAMFCPQTGRLAVTSERGVTVYQPRATSLVSTSIDFLGNEQIDDIALESQQVWAIARGSQGPHPIHQIRRFPQGQTQASSIGTLFYAQDSSVGPASFINSLPLRLHVPQQAVFLRPSQLPRFRLLAAASQSQLLAPEAAQLKLIEPFQSHLPDGHACLNGAAEFIAPSLNRVAQLQVTDSGRAAYGINSDGRGVVCLNMSDFSVLGEWSSLLESSLTGNANPLSLGVSGELAVIGGNDGIVHLIQTDGTVIGRGQFSDSQLLAIDAVGQQVIAGAFNGDVMVARLDQLNQPQVWPAHQTPITAVAVWPQGAGFVTGTQAGQVTLWVLQSDGPQPIVSLPVAQNSVRRLRLDDRGERLAVIIDHASSAQVWDLIKLREYFASRRLAW